MTTPTAAAAGDDRSRLLDVLAGITAVDEVEARHLASTRERVGGDAPLYRVAQTVAPLLSLHLLARGRTGRAASG